MDNTIRFTIQPDQNFHKMYHGFIWGLSPDCKMLKSSNIYQIKASNMALPSMYVTPEVKCLQSVLLLVWDVVIYNPWPYTERRINRSRLQTWSSMDCSSLNINYIYVMQSLSMIQINHPHDIVNSLAPFNYLHIYLFCFKGHAIRIMLSLLKSMPLKTFGQKPTVALDINRIKETLWETFYFEVTWFRAIIHFRHRTKSSQIYK